MERFNPVELPIVEAPDHEDASSGISVNEAFAQQEAFRLRREQESNQLMSDWALGIINNPDADPTLRNYALDQFAQSYPKSK